MSTRDRSFQLTNDNDIYSLDPYVNYEGYGAIYLDGAFTSDELIELAALMVISDWAEKARFNNA